MKQTPPLSCPHCRKRDFELRLLKDEGVAAVQCAACQRHFLVLDSGDYWFDAIQRGYPKPSRCTCQCERFQLAIAYVLDDDDEVERATLTTTCVKCHKEQRRLSVAIDYRPTSHLRRQPLAACKNPEILFDLRELSLYAQPADLQRVAGYLAEQGCSFCGIVRAGKEDIAKSLKPAEVSALLAKRGALPAYLQIYASIKPLALTEADVDTARKEDAFWKRREVVRFDAPMQMGMGSKAALLYSIHFANEHVAGGKVKPKSSQFRSLTSGLVEWLGREFVTWRGPDCFDNEQIHMRVFGKKYKSKAQRNSR